MGFSVLLCFLVTALTPSCGIQVNREIRYECGPHGKFNYCTDDEIGCVIGCHCHPGYYFDTDTKICELNTKLTQQSQQRYLAEPIRRYAHPTVTTTALPLPTFTANVNEKDYDINKETDGIGDWLYNQFFKAIENQVINNSNNTKSNSDANPLTRRSEGGGEPVINKVMKKNRKPKSRRKKKHMKGRRLKKLLRITEDDSLFDSNSDSDSSSRSSSDDSSDSSDDSSEDCSDSSDEKKSSGGTDSSEHKDHGHKKVIIFNKRPKPPLPSFIFVPNDTPYFPPIGLPPPPLLPMFPMPMVPPPPPPPIIPLPPLIPAPPVLPQTTATPPQKNDANTNSTTTKGPDPNGRRDRTVKPHKKPKPGGTARASEPGKPKGFKHGSKSRLMQKIMEKLKMQRRSNFSPAAKLLDPDYPDIDDISNSLELYKQTFHHTTPKDDQEDEKMPELNDVDFKYLSELIHGVNNSTARRRSPYNRNNELRKLRLSRPSRRNLGPDNLTPHVDRESTDDNYYSNLGRQMASMVRNAESEGFPRFTKNLEYINRELPFHSVLNENSVPRSLWERSVRSLPRRHGQLAEYLDEARTLKHSNEKSLINLENEVEIVASTPRPLSLQEIENILSTVQEVHAHIKFRQPSTSTKLSNISLNVNLLPKHLDTWTCPFNRLCEPQKKVESQTYLPKVRVEPKPGLVANHTSSVFHEPEKQFNIPYRDNWIYNLKIEPIQPKTRPRPVFDETSKPYPKRQARIHVVPPGPTEQNKPHEQYLQFQNSAPIAKATIPKISEAKVINYNSLNYYTGNKHYKYEAAPYPILTPFKSPISKKFNHPSYFHPNSNYFQYFD